MLREAKSIAIGNVKDTKELDGLVLSMLENGWHFEVGMLDRLYFSRDFPPKGLWDGLIISDDSIKGENHEPSE